MKERVERLQAALEEPLLVSSSVNVRYLCGLDSTNAAMLVEPDRVRLFTDFRYAERARAIRDVEAVETRRNLYADLAERLSGRIGFEAEAVSYARYETLAAGGADLVSRRGLVERLREVKDSAELAAVRRSASILSDAFAQLAGEPFVGRSERELVWRITELMHEGGADEAAFAAVVAGEAGASPHAAPGDRRIEVGETVVVDAGCRVNGYCSDCTRTFATGQLPAELDEAYAVTLRAQLAALEAVVPGADGKAVDRVARSIIEEAGLGDRFGHGLGHGVGLEVHEAPWLNPELESTLAAANVVTVEPGVYLPGLGGIRIEDLVIVTDDGPEVLTGFTKELVTVG
ncbi:MAG TPA: Xaa-Pro peptidase family protein [Gaiellaceae bacterium]|nr:Xaa-Pro peptidase family protein [Gaiellaceae bacterium]